MGPEALRLRVARLSVRACVRTCCVRAHVHASGQRHFLTSLPSTFSLDYRDVYSLGLQVLIAFGWWIFLHSTVQKLL